MTSGAKTKHYCLPDKETDRKLKTKFDRARMKTQKMDREGGKSF